MNLMAFSPLANRNLEVNKIQIPFGTIDFQLHPSNFTQVFESLDEDMDLMIESLNFCIVSWEFRDSSHGKAYWRGSTLVTMGPARDRANRDTSIYPGSGPSWLEVNPYFSLLCIDWVVTITVLLKLFRLEEEEEDRISPMLRVQAPLYRRGPGYRFR
jgi:hypothetical protein